MDLPILGFPGGLAVKNPPVMQESQETWVRSLGREDPLEKGMTTHSSILAWRTPRTEEPGGLQPIGSQSQTQLSEAVLILSFKPNQRAPVLPNYSLVERRVQER